MSDLLQRTSRRIAPTEIGRQSMARAQRMLAEAEAGRIRTCAVATLCEVGGETTLRTVLHWVDEPDLFMALSGAVAKMARDIAEE